MDPSLFQDLYKHLYKNEHLSDLTLKLLPLKEDEIDITLNVPHLSLSVHSVILSASCEYFRTTLARWNPDDSKVVEVKVGSNAMFAYTATHPTKPRLPSYAANRLSGVHWWACNPWLS